jgi:hypothetical protein
MRAIPVPLNNPLPGAPLPSRGLAALNLEEPVVLDFGARAQSASPLSLPISPHAAALGTPSPSRNFIGSAKPKSEGSKPITPWPPSNSPSPSTESAIRAVDPDHLVLRPRKMHSGQRFSYLALEPEETRALNAAYHERIHRDQSNLIPLGSRSLHPNGSRTALQRPLPPKRHGPGWP